MVCAYLYTLYYIHKYFKTPNIKPCQMYMQTLEYAVHVDAKI